jgi:DNA-binding transcriptional regulator WhiA
VIEEQYGETISKSGMKHRLGKLKETAARLEEADAR